ncbi:putative phosphatidate phosphatase [Ctenocephalides felis]|uniref:putative phosphatidate phosphatase n=1 Tax=Ctenocephalides felis TaxID=7515 RepID=UPI000E6E33C2|nr:putative phosphatidate phosphatase [Ctenocephalides felis]XP_026475113.1 putative phosphatidate phosphatase [Ctenocephalides felis]
MLYLVGLLFPVSMMVCVEIFRARGCSRSSRTGRILGHQLPAWLWSSYCAIGTFAFGVACSQLTTDIAKYSIGRLRPHFFDVCRPDVDCTQPSNFNRYIENFECLATNKRLIKEMRLSFPSGHSSFSAYTMLYCVMYLQARMSRRGAYLVRNFLQFLLLMMFWYTALSRISDYKHHWSDVLAGSLLGMTVAIVTRLWIFNITNNGLLDTELYGSCTPNEKSPLIP